MKKSTILMILLVIFIMGLVGCGKKEESSVIRVAVCPTSPPNLFEENGKYKGLDLELFEGFCKARNRQYKITSYDWQGMLGAVIGKQADVAFSAISITDKRKEVMDFSSPYMDNKIGRASCRERVFSSV